MRNLCEIWLALDNYSAQNKTDYVKYTIGDSLNNNRTLTVNQLVRFLTRKNASATQRQLGKRINNFFNTALRNYKPCFRSEYSNRTDAYDVNEFKRAITLSFYE